MSQGTSYGKLCGKVIEKWNVMNVIAGDVSELIQQIISESIKEINDRDKKISELEKELANYKDKKNPDLKEKK